MQYLISFYVFDTSGKLDKFTMTRIIDEEPIEWFRRAGWKEEHPGHTGCVMLFCYMSWAVKEKT